MEVILAEDKWILKPVMQNVHWKDFVLVYTWMGGGKGKNRVFSFNYFVC
jgi:hypothetical protein